MKNKFFSILLLVIILFTFVSIQMQPIYAVDTAVKVEVTIPSPSSNPTTNPIKVTLAGEAASGQNTWSTLFDKYKNVIIGISGAAAVTFLAFFIVNFVKLGQSSGNPQMRSHALMGLIWCGIGCTCLGGIALFFGFFYNALT